MISAIKRFKEENEIVEDEPDFSAEDSISSLSNSQLRDIIKQEIGTYSDSDSKADTIEVQKTSDSTLSSDTTSHTHKPSVVAKNPEITLPSKNNSRRPSRKTNALWPYKKRQPYTELQPVNIQPKTKADLIPFTDKNIKELLEENECEICFISPISSSPHATPDTNMKRCQALIELLKKNDYLYFPVYLYDSSLNQILTTVFMVYNATVKTIKIDRTFNDMFKLITEFSWKYLIQNLVYWKGQRFILKHSKQYSYLDLNSSKEVINYICELNQFEVTKYCQLMVNPFCSDKMDYLERHISENELCVIIDEVSANSIKRPD